MLKSVLLRYFVCVYSFVNGLRDHLLHLYPLSVLSNCSHLQSLVHIHYQRENYIVQYTPLILLYIILCFYIFFSVRQSLHVTYFNCNTVVTT